MSIMLDETLLALWHIQIDGLTDFLAGLSTTAERDRYLFLYRVKRYASPAPFDPRDERSWTGYTLSAGSPALCIKKVRLSVMRMAQRFTAEPDKLVEVIRNDREPLESYARRIAAIPSFHSYQASLQELDEYNAQILAAEEQRRGRK